MEIYEVNKQKLEIYQLQLNQERMKRIREEQVENIYFSNLNGINPAVCKNVWGVDEFELLQLSKKIKDSHTIYIFDECFYCLNLYSSLDSNEDLEQQKEFKEYYIENGLSDYRINIMNLNLFYDRNLGSYVFLNPIQRRNLQSHNVACVYPIMGSVYMEKGCIAQALQYESWENTLTSFDMISHTTLNEKQCLDLFASGFFDYETLSRKLLLHKKMLPYIKK